MKQLKHLIVASSLIASQVLANDSIRTELSFTQDEEGNLNPEIFLPVYYGSDNQFFSGVGYSSKNFKEVSKLDNFVDSKNALISEQKEIRLSYINYQKKLSNLSISVGLESFFTNIKNNEFGYIHDSADIFGNGSDYYIAFDNDVELDIQAHVIRADITLPLGEYFNSRLGADISPFSSVGVKQNTLFKPLVNANGISDSSTTQKLSYSAKLELQTNTGSFFDLVFIGSYKFQPVKYEVAQLDSDGTNFIFKNATIDTDEITTRLGAKVLFDYEMLGGLRPSIGYMTESITKKNNVSSDENTVESKLLSIGFEKRF